MRRVHDEFVRRICYSCLFEEVKSIRALHGEYDAGSEGVEGRFAFASEEHEANYRWATAKIDGSELSG